MKTINHFLQIMILAIFMASFIPMNAQEIMINGSFSSDTTFNPFNGEHDVYSFKMNGYIELLSDSSLIRVVLIDNAGNHWLIYEAYPLIDTLNSFSVQDACDETCFLNKITPDSIRVDIINAIVSIEKFSYDLNEMQNVHDLQVQQKWVNDSTKISVINRRIVQEHMYWRAGKTDLTLLTFSEKENRFSRKFNIEGYEYFKGGIFEWLSNIFINSSNQNSNIVTHFDWRSRHGAHILPDPGNNKPSPYYNSNGKGWITNPKFQGEHHNTCWAFSAIALQEAFINLYYNNGIDKSHQLNLNRSVMEILRCSTTPQNLLNCADLGPPSSWTLAWMKANPTHEDYCYQYDCGTTSTIPVCLTNWSACYDPINMNSFWHITGSSPYYESLKESLILYGPISCYIKNYPPPAPQNPPIFHQMLLVGFKVLQSGDTLYKGNGTIDPPIILEENSRFEGETYWYFKDSQAYPTGFTDDPPVILGDDWPYPQIASINDCNYFLDEITRTLTPNTIKCSDEDGDGYYWWGIHWDYNNGNPIKINPQLCNCPPGVVNTEEEDCDDNDPNAGPYSTNSNPPPQDSLLYSCHPNDCAASSTPYSVCATTPVWNTDRHINSDIIIPWPYALTITAQVFMAPGRKIIVKPGGRLILGNQNCEYPARISSGCGEFWGGIEVQGNPMADQYGINQGKVIIENGIIENAVCGIKTFNTSSSPGYCGIFNNELGSPSGGIVQAKHAIFKNNINAVVFFPYRDGTEFNKSYFNHCTFTTDKDLFNNNYPGYFLTLNGVNFGNSVDPYVVNNATGYIRGCIFQNNTAISSQNNYRGTGILLFNSEVYLDNLRYQDDYCIGSSGNLITQETSFRKLERGIYGLCSGFGPSYFTMTNSSFSGNHYGLYLSGFTEVNPIIVENNVFEINNNIDDAKIYGMYLDNCSGFQVDKNNFTGPTFAHTYTSYGCLVNNSGGSTNYIYNNDFETLDNALQGQNKNCDIIPGYLGPTQGQPLPNNGLQFTCNNFNNCKNDILDNDDYLNPPAMTGITTGQGKDLGENSPFAYKDPAGNVFSSLSYQNHDDDINIDESVLDIIYTHHHENETYRIKPDNVSHIHDKNKVTLHDHRSIDAVYNPNQNDPTCSCPDDYPYDDPITLKGIISQARIKIDSLYDLYNILIDEGSTETKNNMVINSTSSQTYEVYTDLMSNSPFLSDTVLKSSIAKEEVLPNEILTDILVANPQSVKNEDILDALENRIIPPTDSMWNEILQGKDTLADKEYLEGELRGWINIKEHNFNKLIRVYLNDTLDQPANDSLISFLNNDPFLPSKYNLVNRFIDLKDYNSAYSILQDIPENYRLSSEQDSTNQRYLTILPVLEQLVNDTTCCFNPDSLQQIILSQLIARKDDLPGAWARNILIAGGILEYQEPIYDATEYKESRIYNSTSTFLNKNSFLKIFPNPCNNYLVVEYTGKVLTPDLEVSLINSENIILLKRKFPMDIAHILFSVKNFNPGIYFIKLTSNGSLKEVNKVVITE